MNQAQALPPALSYQSTGDSAIPGPLLHDRVLHLTAVAKNDYEQSASSWRGGETFTAAARNARSLLTDAKKYPKSPRADALVAFLEAAVAADDDAWRRWTTFPAILADAERALFAAATELEAAQRAAQVGSLDDAEATSIGARVVSAGAKFNARRVAAARASEVPPVPVASISGDALGLALAKTEELERFYADHGVQFDDAGPRPPIDVIAIARRQGTEARAAEAALWLLYEMRTLTSVAEKVRGLVSAKRSDDLGKVFAIRARRYHEVQTYGEMAR